MHALARCVFHTWILLQVFQFGRLCETTLFYSVESKFQFVRSELALLLHHDATLNLFTWIVAKFVSLQMNEDLTVWEPLSVFSLLHTFAWCVFLIHVILHRIVKRLCFNHD